MMNLSNFKPNILFLTTIVISIVIMGCQKDEPITPKTPESHQRSDISKIQSMGIYSPSEVINLLDESGAEFTFELIYSIEAISVDYYSVDAKGEMILVSGALIIPQSEVEMPLLSIQHGTESKRDRVASVSPQNSVEGLIGLMTASMGYITLIPDYPGFGSATTSHPYMHAASLVPCVLDLMAAIKNYCSQNDIHLNDQVFLCGYSEGGYVSLATQKEIEEHYTAEFSLTAVAPMSGPYDLSGMFDTIFNTEIYNNPAYIAWFFNAYNDVYGWNREEEIFSSPYNAIVPGLFDGSKSWGQIENQLPANFSDLIHPEFVVSYKEGNEPVVSVAVSENTLLDWCPKTPVHFIHGDADTIVPYQHALSAYDRFTANGATDIKLTAIIGGTHASSGPEAIATAIGWFEELRN